MTFFPNFAMQFKDINIKNNRKYGIFNKRKTRYRRSWWYDWL